MAGGPQATQQQDTAVFSAVQSTQNQILLNELADLRARVASQDAMLKTAGVNPEQQKELAEDVKWRIAAGLPREHAINCAKKQLEHNKREAEKRAQASKDQGLAREALITQAKALGWPQSVIDHLTQSVPATAVIEKKEDKGAGASGKRGK